MHHAMTLLVSASLVSGFRLVVSIVLGHCISGLLPFRGPRAAVHGVSGVLMEILIEIRFRRRRKYDDRDQHPGFLTKDYRHDMVYGAHEQL